MFTRFALAKVRQELQRSPAVAILGARQVGKTTLARQVVREYPSALYLDLVAPVREGYAFAENVEVLPVHELGKLLV